MKLLQFKNYYSTVLEDIEYKLKYITKNYKLKIGDRVEVKSGPFRGQDGNVVDFNWLATNEILVFVDDYSIRPDIKDVIKVGYI